MCSLDCDPSISCLSLNVPAPQLALRSLHPEDFFASAVVLHTFGPNQTVAKCVLYRWTLPAQTEDMDDLRDGLLSNRVCTVKFPVG